MLPGSTDLRVLAFDTSTARGSVALLEDMELRAEVRLNSLQTHSVNLLTSIDFLLGRLSWNLNDLNLIAVGNGPGSFTGIRIGISTALGFARSLSIPFVEISGLDAIASQASYLTGRIGVVLNAHRSQAFYAEYISARGKIRIAQKSQLLDISALEDHVGSRQLYLVGDIEICCLDKPRSEPSPHPVRTDPFLAASIGMLGIERKRKWRSGDSIISEPTYIRPPDALKKKR